MSDLHTMQAEQNAVFGTGTRVPDHYGDPAGEYAAAREHVALIDRRNAGRIDLTGEDRLKIMHRISTNAVETLARGQGQATVLTTPIGRIIDRVIVHNLAGEQTLLRVSPGRNGNVVDYLRRNIFFRDKMAVEDVTESLAEFALYGPQANEVAAQFVPSVDGLTRHQVLQTTWQEVSLLVIGLDPLGVPGIGLIVPQDAAAVLWATLLAAGEASGLRPAGLDTLELLRIEAGFPGPVGELNDSYIPLETALRDDVSFTKGCYTGQEVIARMESRGKLAKTLVVVDLDGPAQIGSEWRAEGRRQGTLTSAAERPDGSRIGLGFVRPEVARPGQALTLADGGTAVIRRVPGEAHA